MGTSLKDPQNGRRRDTNRQCQFAKNSVEFLDHLIMPDGTEPNKRNIEFATSFPTPAKIKDVCTFFGLCNYYQ